jgi:hypothetical protein
LGCPHGSAAQNQAFPPLNRVPARNFVAEVFYIYRR